jgi:hypothetical protein
VIDLSSMRVDQQLTMRCSLESAWSVDTTFCPEDYAGKDAAHGQCGVTSVFLHMQFGAELWGGMVDGRGHFFVVDAGFVVDYTWRQFPAGAMLVGARPVVLADIAGGAWLLGRCALYADRVRAL